MCERRMWHRPTEASRGPPTLSKKQTQKKTKKINRFQTLLESDYIWVFRTPDGRSVQTNLEDLEPLHRSTRWVVLGKIGRILFKVAEWLEI